jgi:hypothetical protein
MIDLEICPGPEFKRWVLDNVMRWVSPEALQAALHRPERHGFKLVGFRQDIDASCFRHTRYPFIKVVVVYQCRDRTTIYGPNVPVMRQSLMDDFQSINATEMQFGLRHSEEPYPDFSCNEFALEVELRFIVLNYGPSHRAIA